MTDAHALLAAEQSKVLGLKGQRHLRGAVGATFPFGCDACEETTGACLAERA